VAGLRAGLGDGDASSLAIAESNGVRLVAAACWRSGLGWTSSNGDGLCHSLGSCAALNWWQDRSLGRRCGSPGLGAGRDVGSWDVGGCQPSGVDRGARSSGNWRAAWDELCHGGDDGRRVDRHMRLCVVWRLAWLGDWWWWWRSRSRVLIASALARGNSQGAGRIGCDDLPRRSMRACSRDRADCRGRESHQALSRLAWVRRRASGSRRSPAGCRAGGNGGRRTGRDVRGGRARMGTGAGRP